MRVKCKSCEASVLTSPADPARTAADGTPASAATCGKCGATMLYRRRSPTTAEESQPPADSDATTPRPQEMRLPAVVLEAAWWVKFTLSTIWFVCCGCLCLSVLFAAFAVFSVYVARH